MHLKSRAKIPLPEPNKLNPSHSKSNQYAMLTIALSLQYLTAVKRF